MNEKTLLFLLLLIIGNASVHAQDVLPFSETPSASYAGRTLQESMHQWREKKSRLPDDAPNILIIMIDDVGFGQPSTFGGGIATPTLTQLAESGIAYNAFHTTSICSPTRASLLTGRNHHRVGNGVIAEFAADFDGYIGVIPKSSATLAEVLGHYGYNTSAFGKWHNTPATETTAIGPFDRWPTGHGFDYFYGFIAGETSQYEPRLYENTNPVEPPHDEKYHLTSDMADKAVNWLRKQSTYAPNSPFFMYWTPGATHGPHHIHAEWADKYKGKFDKGWQAYRDLIVANQKKMGWVPKDLVDVPKPKTMDDWDKLSAREKRFQTRLMEVYAGFLEHADTQAGKVIDELERQGKLDNTLVFYVLSDNGASAEGLQGTISELLSLNGLPNAVTIEDQMNILDDTYGGLEALGGPKLDNMYNAAWAWAGNAPFQYTKLAASHFGGTRTPLVISWPKGIKPDTIARSQFHHVNDILPTVYDILDIIPPQVVDGHHQDPIDGISMTYTFEEPLASTKKKVQYFENFGSRGVFFDGWYACTFGPRTPWLASLAGIDKWNPDNDVWELYNLKEDFNQSNDLAKKNPEMVMRMKEIFTVEAARNNVFPIGGGLYTQLHPEELVSTGITKWKFYEGMTRTPEFAAPRLGAKNNDVKVTIEIQEGANGVIYALGGMSGGITLFIDGGDLVYEYNSLSVKRKQIRTKEPLAVGVREIMVQSRFLTQKRGGPIEVTLNVDGSEVAKGTVELSVPLAFTASETFDIGTDLGSPVSLSYYDKAPNALVKAKINEVFVEYR
jgi:arylsulfatase A-like enzyme